MKEEWYSTEAVARRWSEEQIEWLLGNYIELLMGYWPINPKEPSGYNEYLLPPLKGRAPRKVRRKRKAYSATVENIRSVKAVLETRLEYAGRDSFLLIGVYTLKQSMEHLARCEQTSEQNIENRIFAALNVMAGVKTSKVLTNRTSV